jgi:oligopeptide transport system ATP-binding protein
VIPRLEVRGLRVRLPSSKGLVTVVEDVGYQVFPGQVMGIAGESGSGKTLSVLALIGLLPAGAVIDGTAIYGERDLFKLSQTEMRKLRGRHVAMVFQDPMTSLHPMMTIERQLTEHAKQHLRLSHHDARDRAIELLREVRLPDPVGALHLYPHQFSGGMRQRIAIAMALICGPELLIADEPTTALDVTVQAGILRLLSKLRERLNLSILLITHDLGVLASIADQVCVLYAGRIVELGPAREIIGRPRHPYTAALLASIPHPKAGRATALVSIGGLAPTPESRPAGCAFHPRCRYARATCLINIPDLVPVPDSKRRLLACPVDPYLGQD